MKKIYTILFTIILYHFSFAYINISPTKLDKNIAIGAYQEFRLYNNTKIPIRYKIKPIDMKEKNVKNMTEWIEIYPKIITINPMEEGIFKVYIKAPENSLNGDYGTFLNIKQISAPKLKSDNTQDITSGLTVMTNLNLGIYGYIGEKDPNIKVNNVKIYSENTKFFIKFDLKNKTNRLIRIIADIEDNNKGYNTIGEYRIFEKQEINISKEIENLKNIKQAKRLIIKDKETNKILTTIKL